MAFLHCIRKDASRRAAPRLWPPRISAHADPRKGSATRRTGFLGHEDRRCL